MKSLAKALLIIACLVLACYMTTTGYTEMAAVMLVFGIVIAVFYEATWK